MDNAKFKMAATDLTSAIEVFAEHVRLDNRFIFDTIAQQYQDAFSTTSIEYSQSNGPTLINDQVFTQKFNALETRYKNYKQLSIIGTKTSEFLSTTLNQLISDLLDLDTTYHLNKTDIIVGNKFESFFSTVKNFIGSGGGAASQSKLVPHMQNHVHEAQQYLDHLAGIFSTLPENDPKAPFIEKVYFTLRDKYLQMSSSTRAAQPVGALKADITTSLLLTRVTDNKVKEYIERFQRVFSVKSQEFDTRELIALQGRAQNIFNSYANGVVAPSDTMQSANSIGVNLRHYASEAFGEQSLLLDTINRKLPTLSYQFIVKNNEMGNTTALQQVIEGMPKLVNEVIEAIQTKSSGIDVDSATGFIRYFDDIATRTNSAWVKIGNGLLSVITNPNGNRVLSIVAGIVVSALAIPQLFKSKKESV